MKLEIKIKDKDCLEAWKEAKKNLKKLKKVFTPKLLNKLLNGEEGAIDNMTEKQALAYFDASAALFLIFIASEVKEENQKKTTNKQHTLDCDDVTSYWNR